MKTTARAAAALLASLAAIATASDVHDLKTDTFKPFIKENDLVLAEFFAPWCGHCKALAPEYEEAATTLKEKNISLVKVDCTAEADLCQEYGVEGYPTLKIFRGLDNIVPYGGQRKAPAIISYMTKQSLPAVSVLTKESLEEFKTADKVVLVAYYDAKDAASNATYETVAGTLRDSFLFGATSDAELAKAEGVKVPGVVLYKQFDEGKAVFDGKFDVASIEEFAKVMSTPLIGEVGPETYAGYMAAQIPLAYIFAESAEERESFAKEFKPIAEKYKGKINIATIDAKAFGQHAQNLNLEVGTWPAFAIQDTAKNQKFPLKQGGTFDAATVGAFVDDYMNGKVEPSIKSEPVPTTQDGPVTVVVAHNYNDIVLDDKKDVLVEFYAPWCGHCKALAPKYEDLGRLFSSHSDKVVISKVDATANDVPDDISGFPTIKLFAAGKKGEPIEYAGARTAEDLAAFIRDNGTHKIDVTGDAMEDVVSEAAKATEEMQHQAPAATKAAADAAAGAAGAASAAASVVENVAEKVAGVVDTAIGGDDNMDDHDEL